MHCSKIANAWRDGGFIRWVGQFSWGFSEHFSIVSWYKSLKANAWTRTHLMELQAIAYDDLIPIQDHTFCWLSARHSFKIFLLKNVKNRFIWQNQISWHFRNDLIFSPADFSLRHFLMNGKLQNVSCTHLVQSDWNGNKKRVTPPEKKLNSFRSLSIF